MTRLGLAIRGDLRATMRRDAAIVGRAQKEGVREETRALQLAMRREVSANFDGAGGRRAGNAIRSRVYENEDRGAAGLVFSKFGRKEGGEFIDYLAEHTEGATITPRRSQWLYIPAPGARGQRRRKRVAASLDEKVEFVPAGDGRKFYLIRRTRTRSTLIATLVRRVRLEPRLGLDGLVRSADQRLARRVFDKLGELER